MIRTLAFSAVVLTAFIFLWEFTAANDPKLKLFLSTPTEVVSVWSSAIFDLDYWSDVRATVAALGVGYALAVFSGFGAGLIFYELSRRGVNLSALILLLGSIPVFALAPLLLLAFGAGFPTRAAVVMLSSVFFIAAGTFQAAESTDNELGSIARDLKVGDEILWRKILIPGSLIYSIPSLKGGIALSLIGVFVAEWISSSEGLGKLILSAMSLYNAPRVMVGIFSFMLIAGLFMFVVSVIEQATTRWRVYR